MCTVCEGTSTSDRCRLQVLLTEQLLLLEANVEPDSLGEDLERPGRSGVH